MYTFASNGEAHPPCGGTDAVVAPSGRSHTSLGVPLFDRRFQPEAKHVQHSSVADPACDRFEQVRMRNRVEVLRKVAIDDIGIARSQRLVHYCHCLLRIASRPISIHLVSELRFENWRQYERRSRLGHAVPDCRNS